MKAKLLLVTGATGLLGKGLEETAPPGWKIVGTHLRDYAVEDARAKHLVLDIRNQRLVDRLFSKHRFDAVIHAAGIASVDYAEKHYAESLESNLQGTLNITAACRRTGTYLVYVSTNAVFDGTKAPYREDDPVRPINKYGRIKVECERLVSETLTNFAIARPILMYGWNHIVSRPNPATWIYDQLMRGETLRMVDDVHENPLYNAQCGQALWALVRKKLGGIIHLAGKDSLNRCEFARAVAKEFGLDAKLIKAVKSTHFPAIAPRPKNTTFVVERMERELGVKAMTAAEGLRAMRRSMKIKA